MVATGGEGTAGFSDDPKDKKRAIAPCKQTWPLCLRELNLSYLENSSKTNFRKFFLVI